MTDAPREPAPTTAPNDEPALDASATAARRFGVGHIVVTVLLGIIAVAFLLDGIGNLVNLPALYEQLELPNEQVPWAALWVGVIHPIAFFAAAVAVGARRNTALYALVLIVALCVMATTRLTLIAVATASFTIVPVG